MHRWVLLLLALVCCGCADKWLIYPSNTPRFAGEAQPRILVDRGRRIEVFVARSPGAPAQGPAAVYCLEFTGNSTRAEDIAEFSARRWGQRSVEVWVMNYPGFGNSDGPASLRLIWDSALFTYDRLKAQAGDRPIVVSGNSLGTTVALGVAARRPVAGMVLRACPPLQHEIMWRYGWWNLWIAASITAAEVPGEMNSLLNAPKVKAPAVFIVTGADLLVPQEYQKLVVDAYAGPKHLLLMEGAAHNSAMTPQESDQLQKELDWVLPQIRGTKFEASNE